MKFAISANPYKDPGYLTLLETCRYLLAQGAQVLVDQRNRSPEGEALGLQYREDFSGADVILSLGGDGTFLNAVHSTRCYDIPIVGVNLGSVGFLAEIRVESLHEDLDRLLARDYSIEERMMLHVAAWHADGQRYFEAQALNEALLSRGYSQRIVPARLYLDDSYIETVRCDGLIVGTPTGSTGYAMAAGGPIVQPNSQLIQITPVCPYSLQNRSYILDSATVVRLELGDYPFVATLSADGRQETAFRSGDCVEIRRAERSLRLIHFRAPNFFQILPEKLRTRTSGLHSQ